MTRHGSATDLDPFLSKESLDSLARMGFGKRRPRLGPHRYHGIAARTRLSIAGKVTSLASIARLSIAGKVASLAGIHERSALLYSARLSSQRQTLQTSRHFGGELENASDELLVCLMLPSKPLNPRLQRTMASSSEQRRQHHKERVTINQVLCSTMHEDNAVH